MAEGLHAEVSQIEVVLRGYEPTSRRLQAKLAEARARQNAIASRFESAVSPRQDQRSASRQPHDGSLFEVRAARRRADFAEGRADALGLAGPRSLEEEIADLRSTDAVDASSPP